MREGFEQSGTFWSGVECKVERKSKEIKKKKGRGTCVEEVAGKKRKEGNKEKKLRVRVWRRKKEGKKKGNMDKKNIIK